MLVNIIQDFDDGTRRWYAGSNPDVPYEVAQRWIADSKAVAFSSGAASSPELPVYVGTWAGKPAASAVSVGSVAVVTDIGVGGRSWWWSDGTYWRPVNNHVLLSRLLSPVTTAANASEQFLSQVTIPAGMLIPGAVLYAYFGVSDHNVGTAETFTLRLRVGSAGSAADAVWLQNTTLATTQLNLGTEQYIARASSTTMRKVGCANNASLNPNTTTSTAITAAITVADMDAAANIVSFSSQASVGTETITVNGMTLGLRA